MKIFLIKSFLFIFLVVFTLFPIFRYISKDFSDRFYDKFLYKAPSLIIGSSRALYALMPEHINNNRKINKPFLNFGFTMATSPYGEVYYDAIMKKVKSANTPGVFILEVNPLTVSLKRDTLPETKLILNRLKFFNMNPNIDYILKNSQHPIYLFFLKNNANQTPDEKNKSSDILSSTVDTASKIKAGIKAYQKVFGEIHISDYRLNWLEKTIASLKPYGKVILVRVPITVEMKRLENNYCPQFNQLMRDIALKRETLYMDFSEADNYNFHDAHHMTSTSANNFSEMLGDTINTFELSKRK